MIFFKYDNEKQEQGYKNRLDQLQKVLEGKKSSKVGNHKIYRNEYGAIFISYKDEPLIMVDQKNKVVILQKTDNQTKLSLKQALNAVFNLIENIGDYIFCRMNFIPQEIFNFIVSNDIYIFDRSKLGKVYLFEVGWMNQKTLKCNSCAENKDINVLEMFLKSEPCKCCEVNPLVSPCDCGNFYREVV